MIRRSEEKTLDVKQMFGGQGQAKMYRILEGAGEMYGKGRVFNHLVLEPGCEIGWHIHHGDNGAGDQILLCTAGSGWYQAEGEEPVSLEPGSATRIPAGLKYWHGAKADSWFSHLAFITLGEGECNEWLEPVTDEEYDQLSKD